MKKGGDTQRKMHETNIIKIYFHDVIYSFVIKYVKNIFLIFTFLSSILNWYNNPSLFVICLSEKWCILEKFDVIFRFENVRSKCFTEKKIFIFSNIVIFVVYFMIRKYLYNERLCYIFCEGPPDMPILFQRYMLTVRK